MQFRDTVFIKVAELLSFSKAAEALFISQPAITKHIKQLEQQWNVILFDRKGNKIYLSKAGKMVYDRLKEIDSLYNDLNYSVGRINEEYKGSIKIGASSTIAQYILPPVLASFHKRYSKIDLNLFNGNSSQMEEMLIQQDIDLAMVENKSQMQNLSYFTFSHDRLVAITRSKGIYSKHKELSLNALRNIPLVLREYGSGTLQILEDALHLKGINLNNLNVVTHLGSTEAIKSFLSSFDGIAFVSNKSIVNELALNKLTTVDVIDYTIKRELKCVTRQGIVHESAKLFINHLNNYNF